MLIWSEDCPCKGCTQRKIGCHSLCSKYKEWRLELDKKKVIVERNEKLYPWRE